MGELKKQADTLQNYLNQAGNANYHLIADMARTIDSIETKWRISDERYAISFKQPPLKVFGRTINKLNPQQERKVRISKNVPMYSSVEGNKICSFSLEYQPNKFLPTLFFDLYLMDMVSKNELTLKIETSDITVGIEPEFADLRARGKINFPSKRKYFDISETNIRTIIKKLDIISEKVDVREKIIKCNNELWRVKDNNLFQEASRKYPELKEYSEVRELTCDIDECKRLAILNQAAGEISYVVADCKNLKEVQKYFITNKFGKLINEELKKVFDIATIMDRERKKELEEFAKSLR